MDQPMLSLRDVRKEFRYLNPDPNNNDNDMWVAYLLGLLGRKGGQFAAKRRRIEALRGISLDVSSGEFFGVLGPNGAGKSTLVKLISTILTPTSGIIRVNGFDASRDRALVRASLSVVPAGGWLSFDSHLTIGQNLSFWGQLYGLGRREVRERVTYALDVVGMQSWIDEQPGTASSGMRQRLAIAKGLLVRAPLFVLDEPTANVDPAGSVQVHEFIRQELNRTLGQTVIITTHNMDEAEYLCDRVALIEQGTIVACDRPSRLVSELAHRVYVVQVTEQLEATVSTLRSTGLVTRIMDYPDGEGGGEIRVLLADGASEAELSRLVEGAGLTAASVDRSRATLEDVFLERTGRGLRNDE